ncbi:MAG: glycosyltransferase family 4 protein [Candidatus Sericytochromatia bacterium]|nr:glycosyltransferase family 4 protein [Candidatus Sericytochromatia bacterium]
MRILMVGHEWFSDHAGGGGRYLHAAASGLAARGHAVTVLVPRQGTGLPEEMPQPGLRLLRAELGERASTWWRGLLRVLPGLVERFGPFDVVHSHFAAMGLVPLWHPCLKSTRRIGQFQGPWAIESRWAGHSPLSCGLRWAIERLAYARCHRHVVLSRAFAELLAATYGVDPARIEVVPAGVDTDRFKPADDRAALRAQLGVAHQRVCLATRRLVQRMGLDVLLRAWSQVAPQHSQARLVLAGEGPLRGELEALTDRLGLRAQVTFLGRIADDELVAWNQAADLAVLPTRDLEGFGLATVEALACGTPVIGTQASATPEILGPLDAGLLVPPADVDAMASRLGAWLEGRAPGPSREACRNHVLAHYTWPRAIDRLERILAGN